MPEKNLAASEGSAWQVALGYLNFSSGTPDVRFLRALNALFAQFEAAGIPENQIAARLHAGLVENLDALAARLPAFADTTQAGEVIRLVFDGVLPAYRQHHRDLLFHLGDADLLRPLFLGRIAEAVLAEGGPWDETERIVAGALGRLNDFLGYRPVAVLNNNRRVEPYAHERVRPIPWYVAGAGVAPGRYHDAIALALDLLRATNPALLESAWFDPNLLDELAIDPRAYDFNHPANKRPNYHFGQWDPHLFDSQGRYRRFVVQQVTLEALWQRVETVTDLPRDELLFEAAAVLAGTILMASGTSGNSPEAHDSSTTLATLLPQIAKYRDAFYKDLFSRLSGPHRERLLKEAEALHQPFGAARQHLNAQLARRRALQMQHVHLALLFARLGFDEAALRQVNIVPAVSARMVCQIHCLIAATHRAADRGRLSDGVELLAQIDDLLRRGIQCGAIVDPWNILGFGGQFSLFPAIENSIPDGRIDELLDLMDRLFNTHARLWHEAAASNQSEVLERLPRDFQRRAEWWDKFATTSVSGLRSVSGREMVGAARHVAEALSAWHQAGAGGGDLNFWRPYVEQFDSPQAYGWVTESLLERRDLAAAMALLIHWLSQAESVRLEEGPHSFHALAERWLRMALADCKSQAAASATLTATAEPAAKESAQKPASRSSARLIGKFFDFIEANAESYWNVPELEVAGPLLRSEGQATASAGQDPSDTDEEQPDSDDVYGAAYEEMVYRDSTNDDVEGSMLESANPRGDDELELQANRLVCRLAFLRTLARLWRRVALASAGMPAGSAPQLSNLDAWRDRAEQNARELLTLAAKVAAQPLPPPSGSPESLVEYDRRSTLKESVLERIIGASVAMEESRQFLDAAIEAISAQSAAGASTLQAAPDAAQSEAPSQGLPSLGLTESSSLPVDPAVHLWRAVLSGNPAAVREGWSPFLAYLRQQPLLYLKMTKGGDPRQIAAARSLQQSIRQLLRRLPRLGLLREACQLIETARLMERDHPLGPGSVTEFHQLFEVGFQAIVETVVDSAEDWGAPAGTRPPLSEADDDPRDAELIDALQHVTQSLLSQWSLHSMALRLSVLDKVASQREWLELTRFIEHYGHGLFTQSFFNIGNLRAILHEGVDAWLDQISADTDTYGELALVVDLGDRLPRAEARKHLTLIIEAIIENYSEYRDYNSTTTQSDQGELLYTLMDFLQLKAVYERIHWNLRPVLTVHEVLVRQKRDDAARMWARAMAKETQATADQQLRRLGDLQRKHGMRLATVGDRLGERFLRPLVVDRLRAMVPPAAVESRGESPGAAFAALETEATQLAEEPTGAGLDPPDWLIVLEEEVDRAVTAARDSAPAELDDFPRIRLTWDEIKAQLSNWEIRLLEDRGKST